LTLPLGSDDYTYTVPGTENYSEITAEVPSPKKVNWWRHVF